MIRYRTLFSKKLPELIARKVFFYLKDYLSAIDTRNKEKKEAEWNKLFVDKKFIEHKLNQDVRIRLYKDSYLSKLIFNGFEVEELDFLRVVLKDGDIFIDIGANIGLFSLSASVIVGVNGRVISYEPTPNTFSRLLENVELNSFSNVDAKNIGLSETCGNLVLNISDTGFDAWNSFTITDNSKFQASVSVPVSTLDEELKCVDKSKVKMIKIDVEGWEKFVIKGGINFFKDYCPILMIEFTESNAFAAGYFIQEVYDILNNLGYKWFRYKNGMLFPEDKKLHYPYDNLIAFKDNIKSYMLNIGLVFENE